jgi:small subunit ribosomal protein S15
VPDVEDPWRKRIEVDATSADEDNAASPQAKETKDHIMSALHTEKKQEIISRYRQHGSDTGSPEVQIALISERITYLTDHFKTHAKDHHSRRGLLKLVSKRRHMLDYLKRSDLERYRKLIRDLGIRK